MYYYRDKDAKEIDIVLEHDGVLNPIEIKKTSNPGTALVKVFDLLDKCKQVIIRTLTPKNKPSFSGGFNVIFLYKALPAGLWTRAEAGPVLPLLEMVPSGAAVPVHM